jgi:tetratricopeptide (TPR) repeat protein
MPPKPASHPFLSSMAESDKAPTSAGLQPPGVHPGPPAAAPAKHGFIWGALAVVITLGLAVVLVLPKMVSDTHDESDTAVAEQAVAGTPQASGEQAADSRRIAEQAMQDFLHVRARLELANAPVWGEPEWSQALEGSARGNDLFGQRQFSMAAEALTASTELLLSLESGSGQRLQNALDSGWQALQLDDGAGAEIFFETALSIETDNEVALTGLARARVRSNLLGLMAAGEVALSTNDLLGARAAYRQATELDGAYEPAEMALYDVNEKITELAFSDAMSRALRALEAEQVEAAEAALKQAATLKPGDEVVRNTQYQLAQTRQKLWLAGQRKQATRQEANENWAAATAIYRKVLASVPQAGFANQGLSFAEDRERLHRQFDHYLADPTRVWSDEPRANAEQLIESAGTPPESEPRLAEKASRLQKLIIEADTPRTVTLQSDGLTQVQIYHVGRFGQFTSQQLELRPGTYTIVGSRQGYRDVRQTFTVKPGSDQPLIVIRCEEPV